MRLISWNVNGLRAALKKDFRESFDLLDADVFALQETKLQPGQVDLELPGYCQFWSYAQKKGYSGTAVFCKARPRQVLHGLGDEYLDAEGRIVAVEFEQFWFVDVYTPNAQDQLARIDHRMQWDDAFRDFCKGLEEGVLPAGVPVERDGDEGFGVGHAAEDLPLTQPGETADSKPVVMCGDFNVAHEEIDLKSAASSPSWWKPGSSTRSACCTPICRARTLGGATASRRVRTTRGGASTTSW